MKLDRLLYVFLILGIFLIVYKGSVYIIDENEQVVISQFGKILKTRTGPGFYFKIPGMQKTHYYKKEIIRTESSYQVYTIDKKLLSLTVLSSWKISDPALFLSTIRDTALAETRVEDEIKLAIKAALVSFRLDDLVNATHTANFTHLKRKTDIEKDVLKSAKPKLQKFGIELIEID